MTAMGVDHATALRSWSARAPAPPATGDLPPAELVRHFHPDHQADHQSELRVGACAGMRCPSGLADLLQANAHIDDVDLAGIRNLHADVLVLGGGAAGVVAALTAARDGAAVMLATKLRLGDGNTVMAEGGIQAAVGADDSLQQHFDDTLAGGHATADPELVAALVSDGPAAIRWLMAEGMAFDQQNDQGDGASTLRRLRPGGTTVARLLSYRDFTGLEMMRALREAVLLQPGVEVRERYAALELLTDPHGRCVGAVLLDLERERLVQVRAGAVILATGGAGRTHLGGNATSNHYGATADGLVLAYRVGACLREIDSFQYHPTGLAWPRHLRGLLITEAVRALGARLVNGDGARFIDELAPRDVVAAAILREIDAGRGVERDGLTGVLLDTPTLERERPGVLQNHLITLVRLARKAGIDPASEPLLIAPTLHYQNGGVAVDTNGQSSIPGLLCAGEIAGGIHGRNRLMGNALLETVVYGRRAGKAAVTTMRNPSGRAVGITHLGDWQRGLIHAGLPLDRRAPVLFPAYGHADIERRIHARRKSAL